MSIVPVLSKYLKLDARLALNIVEQLKNNDAESVYFYLQGINVRVTMEEIRAAMLEYEKYRLSCANNGIGIVCAGDKDFPLRFYEYDGMPPILYYMGNISIVNEQLSVAVIGTRKPTDFGIAVTKNLTDKLCSMGYYILNGLAIGCDAYAIETANVRTNKAVVVLPCGLDRICPSSNIPLLKELLKNGGCAISEYAPGVAVQKYMYIERDRLQAVISKAVIVVESTVNSGTMHTVKFAKKYDVPVGCFMKESASKNSDGNNYLVSNGIATSIGNSEELESFLVLSRNDGVYQMNVFDYFQCCV